MVVQTHHLVQSLKVIETFTDIGNVHEAHVGVDPKVLVGNVDDDGQLSIKQAFAKVFFSFFFFLFFSELAKSHFFRRKFSRNWLHERTTAGCERFAN